MNATTTFSRKIRLAARRLLVALAVLAAGAGIAVGSAGPSHAATYVHEGTYSINSYYGWSAGNAYIPYNTQHFVSVAGHHRDTRSDGYCSVVHMRGVYGNGAVSGWYRVGNNCSTTASNYSTARINAPSGMWFRNAQVRVCQSDRYGRVIGTCSGAVSAGNWRLISY